MDDSLAGAHCSQLFCNQKDFLPFKCLDCNKFFCDLHRHISCSTELVNPIVPQYVNKLETRDCMFWQVKSDKVPCKGRAISTCPLCNSIFCIQHRFEDQHECRYLAAAQQIEEVKTDQKQLLMAKIKARNNESIQFGNDANIFSSDETKLSDQDIQKRISQQKITRIKVKSTAKGDLKVPRDQRYAVSVKFEESAQSKLQSGNFYFQQSMCIGQALDQICVFSAIQLVLDSKNIETTRLKAKIELLDGSTILPLTVNLKLLEIQRTVAQISDGKFGFEQGDQIVVYR